MGGLVRLKRMCATGETYNHVEVITERSIVKRGRAQLDKGSCSETRRPSFSWIRPGYRCGPLSKASIKRGLPPRLG